MKTIARLALAVLVVLAVVACGKSPAVKDSEQKIRQSQERYTVNQNLEKANYIDKKSVQTEPESGIIAVVKRDSEMYNENGDTGFVVKKGKRVWIHNLDLQEEPSTRKGFIMVTTENKFGDFWVGELKGEKTGEGKSRVGYISIYNIEDLPHHQKPGDGKDKERVSEAKKEEPAPKKVEEPKVAEAKPVTKKVEATKVAKADPKPKPTQKSAPVTTSTPKPRFTPVAFNFTPNKWDVVNKGCQKVTELEPGDYVVRGEGSYKQYFYNDNGNGGYPREITVDGRLLPENGEWTSSPYQNYLPLPNRGVGYLTGKIENDFFPIGREARIHIERRTALYVTTNFLQNSASFGNPLHNFDKNEGTERVTVEKVS